MGFPRDIRERALVLSARHCCVGHRYRGLKVEVHHIDPEAGGGLNILDNAVSLCFDCHADAGHYNPSHPRGTRFSSREIRTARDAWYSIVASGQVETPSSVNEGMLVRHFVCSDWNAIREISLGQLANIPVSKPLLLETEVLTSLRRLVAKDRKGYRHSATFGRSFGTLEELKARIHAL